MKILSAPAASALIASFSLPTLPPPTPIPLSPPLVVLEVPVPVADVDVPDEDDEEDEEDDDEDEEFPLSKSKPQCARYTSRRERTAHRTGRRTRDCQDWKSDETADEEEEAVEEEEGGGGMGEGKSSGPRMWARVSSQRDSPLPILGIWKRER